MKLSHHQPSFSLLNLAARTGVVCVVLFAALTIFTRVLGAGEPLNPVLAGFVTNCENKPQPCWYGIVPGLTRDDDVHGLIAFAGRGRYAYDDLVQSYSIYFTPPEPTPACVFTFRTNRTIVTRIEIALCKRGELRTGDLTALWDLNKQTVSLPPHSLVSGKFSFSLKGWPAPTSPITSITLQALPDTPQQYPWHGFVPLWRYCQIEPIFPQCH